MSKRRDFPTVYARVPVSKIKAENKAILEQVRQAERHGKSPIKDQVALLVNLVEVYGLGVCGSTPTEYRRWCSMARLDC